MFCALHYNYDEKFSYPSMLHGKNDASGKHEFDWQYADDAQY